MFDSAGGKYLDFLSSAGSLNYGHNDPQIMGDIVDHIRKDGILQSLDLVTTAKVAFLRDFDRIILKPRKLTYKTQFTGPTGANAVEAAIKLARKITGRSGIVAFTNAYHGLSLGALSLTGNKSKRKVAGVSLNDVIRLPFDGYAGPSFDTAALARSYFEDSSSGFDLPAAFIVETVQGEGGLNVASASWLQAIAQLAADIGALVIVDDIQAGCGRTGSFFSFESLGIAPDIICLSKSISGSGLPMAINLIKPQFDLWDPGEHTGTFRGNNLAFVGASAALRYWGDGHFQSEIEQRAQRLDDCLRNIVASTLNGKATVVGKGLMKGIKFADPAQAELMRIRLLSEKVISETCGPKDEVLKFLPALNIPINLLEEGLDIIRDCSPS